MKALTIQQPWASAIMAGVKRVENRTWATKHRGPLVIHAGQQVDPAGLDMLAAAGVDVEGLDLANAPRGVILGKVELVDVIRLDDAAQADFTRANLRDDPLATGPVCWILENPQPLEIPTPATGARGLWDW